MLYAVATMDTVMIYDTQQAGPVCLLTKLHYDEFTDMSWCVLRSPVLLPTPADHRPRRSPDGQCLILASRDGYCTLVVFDEPLAPHHTQQHTLQLQSIAHHHSLPLTNSTVATPLSTPSRAPVTLPSISPAIGSKRKAEGEPPLTPAPSVDESVLGAREPSETPREEAQEPPKKKRRAALTRIGDVGS